jgi:hypothetical protein
VTLDEHAPLKNASDCRRQTSESSGVVQFIAKKWFRLKRAHVSVDEKNETLLCESTDAWRHHTPPRSLSKPGGCHARFQIAADRLCCLTNVPIDFHAKKNCISQRLQIEASCEKNKLPAFAAVAPFARIAFHLAAEGDTKRPATARARMRFQSSHRVRDAAGPKCRAASRDAELISRSPQRSAARRCVALRCVTLRNASKRDRTTVQLTHASDAPVDLS